MNQSVEIRLMTTDGQVVEGSFASTMTVNSLLQELEAHPEKFHAGSNLDIKYDDLKSDEDLRLTSYKGVPPTQSMASGAIQLHITIKGTMQASVEVMPLDMELTPRPTSVLSDEPQSPYLLINSDDELKAITLGNLAERFLGHSGVSKGSTGECTQTKLNLRHFFRYQRPKMTEEEVSAALASAKEKLGIASMSGAGSGQNSSKGGIVVGQGGFKSLLHRAGLGNKKATGASKASAADTSDNQIARPKEVIVPPRDEKISVTVNEEPPSDKASLLTSKSDAKEEHMTETAEFYETTGSDWVTLQEDMNAVAKRAQKPAAPVIKTKDFVRIRVLIPSPFQTVAHVDEYHSVKVEVEAEQINRNSIDRTSGLTIEQVEENSEEEEEKEGRQGHHDIDDGSKETVSSEQTTDQSQTSKETALKIYTSKGRSMLERKDLASHQSQPGKIATYEPAHPPITVEAQFHIFEPLTSLYSFIENLFASTVKISLEHGDDIDDEYKASVGSAFEEYPFYVFTTLPHRRLDAKGKEVIQAKDITRVRSLSDETTLYDAGITRPMRLHVAWLKKPLEIEWSDSTQYQRLLSSLRGDLRRSSKLQVSFAQAPSK